MATISVGGRDLEVKECTIDLWKDSYRPYQQGVLATMSADPPLDVFVREEKFLDLFLDLALAFIGHNEGVDRKWLAANMRYPVPENELTTAAGLRKKESVEPAPGEAKSQ